MEPEIECESRSKDYKASIYTMLKECLSLIPNKDVDLNRLRIMLKQQTAMCNVLRNAPASLCSAPEGDINNITTASSKSPVGANDHDTTTPNMPFFKSLRKSRPRKIQPVITQYKFRKKRKRMHATAVKPFRKPANRSNLITSLSMSAVGGGQLQTPPRFSEPSELKLTLSVNKRGTRMSLDGIVFYPVVAGMVVPDDERGFESLNMRVHLRDYDSVAAIAGVTSQHYLYKMRVIHERKTGHNTRSNAEELHIIGSSCFRNVYTNTIDLEKLATSVDRILCSCVERRLKLETTFLAYV